MTHALFESASGFGLFELTGVEEIGEKTEELQKAIQDFSAFSQTAKLKAFTPFTSAENALENINALSVGNLTYFKLGMWAGVMICAC